MINEKTKLDDLFKMAQDAIKELKSEEQFLLKDLFRGFE